MQKNTKVIIVGAGLGGLTAAACLIQKGFHVRIYEQASVLAEVGAGIQTSANAVKVLYDLGLKDALESVAVRPQAFEYRRFDTAELMHRIPLGGEHEKSFGAPYFHLHRADIHELLAKKVSELDPNCITLNAKAIRGTLLGVESSPSINCPRTSWRRSPPFGVAPKNMRSCTICVPAP